MKTIFVDVDTQIDFLFPAGALYVPGSEHIIPEIARLNRYAAGHGIPVISTTDAHEENDPEFKSWPPHCVVGTAGQAKVSETRLPRSCTVTVDPGIPDELADQFIVEKKVLDVFSNPNFPALLDRLKADRYVVYGVATDYCVHRALLGLLATGKQVVAVTDALAAVKPEDGARALADFTSRGGTLTTVAEVCVS
ncbi:MAG: isochorismatase family cysteine hydrolase [Bryobacteraceae bacterium]